MKKQKFITINDDAAAIMFIVGLLCVTGALGWMYGPATGLLVFGGTCIFGAVKWSED